MGVTGSKRNYTPGNLTQGTGDNSLGQFDKAEPGAEGDKPEESAADKKMKNVIMWRAFLKDVINMTDAKDSIETTVLKDKVGPDPDTPPTTDEHFKKGIIIDKDVVKKFVNGEGDYLPELILFTGDVGLKPIEGEQIKLDTAEALKISKGEDGRKGSQQRLNKDVKFSAIKKTIFKSIINAARVAKKHTVFRKILKDYIVQTDSFKKAMKDENISGAKADIKSGDEDAADNAIEANKAKETTGGDEESIDGASIGSASIGSASIGSASIGSASIGSASIGSASIGGSIISSETSSMGGSSIGSDVSSSDGGSTIDSDASSSDGESTIDSASIGGSENDEALEGGLNVYGFRTAKDKLKNKNKKNYKKFKKDVRANFAKKQDAFFNDEEAMSKFMDENENELLELIYNGGATFVGKWINKDAHGPKKTVASNLVAAITAYAVPGEDDGESKGEGESKGDGEGADADKGKEGEGGGDADADAELAEGGTSEEVIGGAPATVPATALVPASEPEPVHVPATEPATVPESVPEPALVQGGGGGIKVNTKKKRHTRKKPQRINISINVGDKNVIDESSSGSSSDSSSSDSESSSDEDTEDKSQPKIHIKRKKHTRKRH